MQESLVEMEVKMRDQIRALQEQRAAAMMNEIVDLQRERDLAMGKIRRLEKTLAGVCGCGGLSTYYCFVNVFWHTVHLKSSKVILCTAWI